MLPEKTIGNRMREIRTYGLNGGLRKRSRRVTTPGVCQ